MKKIIKRIQKIFSLINEVTTYNIANVALARIRSDKEKIANGTYDFSVKARKARYLATKERVERFRNMRG